MNIFKQMELNNVLVELISNWNFIFPHHFNKFSIPYSVTLNEVTIKINPHIMMEINTTMLENVINAYFCSSITVRLIPDFF